MSRWPTVPIAVALCAVLATSCTGGQTETNTPPPSGTAGSTAGPNNVAASLNKLVHSAVSTTLVSSVHVTMRSTLHGEDQPATVTVSGDHDMRHHVGDLQVSMSDGPVRKMHELLTPQQIYISTKDPAKWSSIPRGEVLVQHLLRPPANDPEYPLVQARLITEVVKEGTESINGLDDVTHYTGVLPASTMLKDVASAQRDHLAGLLKAMPESATPIDVWIDEHGRVVRVTETVSASDEGFSGTLTIDVSGYGIGVEVTAPKSSTPVRPDTLPETALG